MGSGKDQADGGQAVKDEAVAGETAAAENPEIVETDLARLTARLEDSRRQMLYLQADFDNYRKRVEREKVEYTAFANERLILDLLDVYENLERALEAAKKQDSPVTKGLEMVYGQMKAVLEKYGLQPIATVGKPFDPRTMEALMQEASDGEEDTVLEELQRGYTLGSKVIRCAKVKVSRK